MTTIFFVVFIVLLVAGLIWLSVVQNRQSIMPQASRRFVIIALTVATILALVTFLAIT